MSQNPNAQTEVLSGYQRYFTPIDLLASALMGVVNVASVLAVTGIGIVDLAIISPNMMFSWLKTAIYPQENPDIETDTKKDSNFVQDLITTADSFLKAYNPELHLYLSPFIVSLNDTQKSQTASFIQLLMRIPQQDDFWNSPSLILWSIVQMLLAVPFMVLSVLLDIYNAFVASVILGLSVVGVYLIYKLNDFFYQLLCLPLTIYDVLFANNPQKENALTNEDDNPGLSSTMIYGLTKVENRDVFENQAYAGENLLFIDQQRICKQHHIGWMKDIIFKSPKDCAEARLRIADLGTEKDVKLAAAVDFPDMNGRLELGLHARVTEQAAGFDLRISGHNQDRQINLGCHFFAHPRHLDQDQLNIENVSASQLGQQFLTY